MRVYVGVAKLGEKLAAFLGSVPVRVVRLESLELSNRELAKICEALQSSKLLSELSFRSNKIDILGVRHIEALCRKLPSLEQIDLRLNDIPHYANLKDKSPIIQFF
jgi:hypothetical protein